ncbi:putative 26S proteasome non-atpase regulatory subunit Rpn6 [Microstroma glucosiphilum]|uniref:Putative 26S proteasome non-atpase regulatory subunit Rpn6 n=1 Tax=Pseudomicrostroma glucosiphilum TaxID=1684307 RepID=A0A316U622_9BASI|nr:putative 26S proteasome non-atpase regulatory subunit Rpn6 [Pseudomicrostroma glucosiphilum]PWN19911.1 putative 26S proteasome non-atpase regulatory subunit Rpn6 [Pseudomicrostroma glucosiphilum]
MTTTQTTTPLDEAIKAIDNGQQAKGEKMLKDILSSPPKTDDEVALRQQENALLRLGRLYRDTKNGQALSETVRSSRTFMASIAKAKTAKLIRSLLDYFSEIPDSYSIQISTIKENIEWARSSRRIFLSQNLETRLIALYYETKQYREALPSIDTLLKELKKLDDKAMLTEVHLLESRVNHAIRNGDKAKASLTSARTAANSIYCPPSLQAQLDMQSGILHAEDKDYSTAYSYFFETLEGLSSTSSSQAPLALKYMLLCKVMLNLSEDVAAIVQGKFAQKYAGRDVEAMEKVAEAHEKRSLDLFEKALKDYKGELSADPIIRAHLSALYDTLLEQNLLRIIEPYSCVEIEHVAKGVQQPVREVEVKLSQMILDKTLHGILDQGAGCLVVFDEQKQDETYEAALDTLKHVSNVVDSLGQKAARLQ